MSKNEEAKAQAVPVAWQYNVDGTIYLEDRQLDFSWKNEAGEYVKGVPLYAAPQPAPSEAQAVLHTAQHLQTLLHPDTLSAAKDTAGALVAMLAAAPQPATSEQVKWQAVPEDDLRHAIRRHLANQHQYSHKEFCAKLTEILLAAPQPAIEAQAVPEGWDAAYAAFQGAFDTPLARRKDGSEYAQDARRRLREFNEAMRAVVPQPPATSEAQAVPHGWKLVPVEPTDDMLSAGYDSISFVGSCGEASPPSAGEFRDVWSAMLAASASPAPAEAKEEP